jgi:hypothetical protein
MHRAHVVHHIPGRVRVKLPHAKGNHAFLQQIKEFLAPIPGVKQVAINSTAGSVVIHYDHTKFEDFHSHLTQHGKRAELFSLMPPEISEVDEIVEKVEREAEFLAEHSDAARTLVNFVKTLNDGVRRATGNLVDLKVLLPLGLAVYSFKEVGVEASTPLWVTLGIFSFNSFVALHHSHPTITTGDHDVIVNPPRKPRTAPRKVSNARPRTTNKSE